MKQKKGTKEQRNTNKKPHSSSVTNSAYPLLARSSARQQQKQLDSWKLTPARREFESESSRMAKTVEIKRAKRFSLKRDNVDCAITTTTTTKGGERERERNNNGTGETIATISRQIKLFNLI